MDRVDTDFNLEIHAESKLTIPVNKALTVYVDSALARLGYLFPNIEIIYDADNEVINCSGKFNMDELKKSVTHALYREKIYQETLELRLEIVKLLA